MARVCKGGAYDGLPIQGPVDEASCLRNEGTIVEAASTGGGCATSAVAVSALGQRGRSGQSAALLSVITGALRHARDRYSGSTLVLLLDEINHEIAPILALRIEADPELRDRLVGLFVDISSMAATLCADDKQEQEIWRYTQKLHDEIAAVARRIGEDALADHLRDKLQEAVNIAERFVGLGIADIAQELDADALQGKSRKRASAWAKFSTLGRALYLGEPVGLVGSGKLLQGRCAREEAQAIHHLPNGLEVDSGPAVDEQSAEIAECARAQAAAVRSNDVGRDIWLPDWARRIVEERLPPERMIEAIGRLLEDPDEQKLLIAQALLNELARDPESAALALAFLRSDANRKGCFFQPVEH